MVVRRWVAGLVWVPLVLGAVGCSGESSGSPSGDEPSSSSAGTPSDSASPSDGPSVPPEAVGSDEASAKAFVRYWFEVLSEAMVTGDTAAVAQLSKRGCRSCASIAGRIENIYDKGGSLKTRGWSAERIGNRPSGSDADTFYVRINEAPSVLRDEDGDVVSRLPATLTPVIATVTQSGETWRMVELEFVE